MPAKLLDGQAQAAKIKAVLQNEIKTLKKSGSSPYLLAIQVGENPASRVYLRQQQKACEEAGIRYELQELPGDISQTTLVSLIEKFNLDNKVSGIIVQMPLPAHLNARDVQIKIAPDKDVEGVHPLNMGMLVYGRPRIIPPTASAALELLKSSGLVLKGKEVTIVGHSEIVGKPIALLLLQSQLASPTPTVCHIATRDLAFHTKRADVLIVAVGRPGLIRAEMIKPQAVVIDIGINRVPVLDQEGKPVLDEQGRLKKKTVGDVDFARAREICAYISPVPGGVGPLTVTMLLRNVVECAKLQRRGSS